MWNKIIKFIKLRIKGNKGISGSIKVIKPDQVTVHRLDRQFDLKISENRVIYSSYDDWVYLQTKKGHPGTFKKLWEATMEKQQRAWNFVGIKSDDKVLDVGFRDGYNLKELEKYCSSVVGLEINEDAINNAKELNCQAFLGDIQQQIPFEDNSFDLIIMLDVLEHCFLPEKALMECNRLLRQDGRMVIEVP
ncbi:MAG: class I SAM-dependent methyltransferase, partial [Candidatus Odinarchaeota archaeon]